MNIEIFTDGICEPNPGHACWGWVAKADGKVIAQGSGYLGERKAGGEKYSNNDAEYIAIGKALRWVEAEASAADKVTLRSDSQLAIRQIAGTWACNKEHLQKYRDAIRGILSTLPRVEISWISSALNREADDLTRSAYKAATGKDAPIRH